MSISIETLKAMIRDFNGFELSDEELELIKPELDAYIAEVEKLRELDLTQVVSARLFRAQDREIPDAGR